MCDGRGRALGFRLLPGNRNELKVAADLLAVAVGLGVVERVVCDRGYSSAAWRDAIREAGAEPVVPAQPTRPEVRYRRAAYRRRHHVEQAWARLKEWPAVATRYEKRAESYLGVLHVAAAMDWIKHGVS